MTRFIVLFASLQWSGTEPAISLRYAYITSKGQGLVHTFYFIHLFIFNIFIGA